MKLKNEVFNNGFIPALRTLLDEKLPVKEAFELRKLANEVGDKMKVYEESRMALVKEFGKTDEKGELIVLKDGNVDIEDIEGFKKKFQELLDLEEDYKCQKITLPDETQLTTKNLILLEAILNIK